MMKKKNKQDRTNLINKKNKTKQKITNLLKKNGNLK